MSNKSNTQSKSVPNTVSIKNEGHGSITDCYCNSTNVNIRLVQGKYTITEITEEFVNKFVKYKVLE